MIKNVLGHGSHRKRSEKVTLVLRSSLKPGPSPRKVGDFANFEYYSLYIIYYIILYIIALHYSLFVSLLVTTWKI